MFYRSSIPHFSPFVKGFPKKNSEFFSSDAAPFRQDKNSGKAGKGLPFCRKMCYNVKSITKKMRIFRKRANAGGRRTPIDFLLLRVYATRSTGGTDHHGYDHCFTWRSCPVSIRHDADGKRAEGSCRQSAGADPLSPVRHDPARNSAWNRSDCRHSVLLRHIDHGSRIRQLRHDESPSGDRRDPGRDSRNQRNRMDHLSVGCRRGAAPAGSSCSQPPL